MKLYPFDLPEDVHPMAWTLLGFGLSPEQVDGLARHLFDDMGVKFTNEPETKLFVWSVGLPPAFSEGERVEVGDTLDMVVSDRQAVRVTGGVLPPGIFLDKTNGKLWGSFTTSGTYSVTVTLGCAVKYDPLGTPGSPSDPGVWIPIEQERQIPDSGLNEFPATVDSLSDQEKDVLLSKLLAEQDHRTIRKAE